MLAATTQIPNCNPVSIWQISLLEDLMANYSTCQNPLQLDVVGKRRPLSMNLKNTSNFLLKISTPVIQFSGGQVNMLSSRICFTLLVIKAPTILSIQPFYTVYTIYVYIYVYPLITEAMYTVVKQYIDSYTV